ncbi:MAG: LegC family aminotransferase [Bacteroidota bacterium]
MTLLSAPNIAGNEWKYVKDCLDTGWVSSVGAYVTQFEDYLASYTGAKYAVATSSGSTALHISLLLAGVQQDDYVIVPNVTFVASLNTIAYTGARPILMDINVDTWQMDLDLLEEFFTDRTFLDDNGNCCLKEDRKVIRAIMPVHILGNICAMDRVMALAEKFGLAVVEDATEALGSTYKGKHAGTFGMLGCISFNGNKIITTGGGGMILTNDADLAKRAKHLTTQAKSDPFEYFHDEIGYNYRLVNVLAAIGVAQMELLPSFIEKKKQIAGYYKENLSQTGDIGFQTIEADVNCNNWLFTIRSAEQKKLLKVLNEAKLQSRPFWVPMNQLPMFSSALYHTKNDLSDVLYNSCLSVPCSTQITDEEMARVVEAIKSVF